MASARGEISLIIAKAGQDVGAITSSVFPILGIVTIANSFHDSICNQVWEHPKNFGIGDIFSLS